jgi:Flp pilus assembly pilin Flp
VIQGWKRKLWVEDEGQDLTEYALLLSLLCLTSVMAMRGFAASVTNMYAQASGHVMTVPTMDNSSSASSFLSTSPTEIHTSSPHQDSKDSILDKTVTLTPREP